MERWDNLPYLIAAYSVVWAAFFGYLMWLGLKLRRLDGREDRG